MMAADIMVGSESDPKYIINCNGTLYFQARSEPNANEELFRSDGTQSGTVLVQDIRPGSTGSVPHDLLSAGGFLFFVANDGTHGDELWVVHFSQGAVAGL